MDCSLRLLQEAECSLASSEVFHVSDYTDIELLAEVRAATNDKDEDELGGAEVTSPLAQ